MNSREGKKGQKQASVFIDTKEWSFIIEILEEIDDDMLAASYLKQLNDLHREWGKVVLNFSPEIDHLQWKEETDRLQQQLSELIMKIKSHQRS